MEEIQGTSQRGSDCICLPLLQGALYSATANSSEEKQELLGNVRGKANIRGIQIGERVFTVRRIVLCQKHQCSSFEVFLAASYC